LIAEEKIERNSIADRCRRRIMRRLMPYLFVLYIIAYLDRVNVGYAFLQLKGDLGFTDAVLGFGAGVFFIGYFILEIPGSLMVEKWSARGWIARIMITWGIVAILLGIIQTKNQFYVLRFLLGAAEAGFFPGIIVYLSHWFRYADRAKALAVFVAAQPISLFIGSPVSGLLLRVNWLGVPGWRWLFIIEGIPAVLFGVATIFYLTDWPHQARWLPQDERVWLISELESEQREKERLRAYSLWEAFRNREVILLTFAFFFMVTTVYGFTFWLPSVLKRLSGSSNLMVSLLSAPPFAAGLFAILIVGWSSDRSRERRWHAASMMILAGLGLFAAISVRDHIYIAVLMFCVAAVGMYGYLPGFWALPTSFLTGSAAAASIGLINSVGNLGGFVGPYVVGYVSRVTGSFFGGVLYLSLSAMIAAGLVLCVRAAKSAQLEFVAAGTGRPSPEGTTS
jgi:ACS family tartrate transporter-like MFS transporter